MRTSLIIPAFDRPELTTAHVKYSMASSRVPDEIIVVNDHGSLELRDMLKALEKTTKVVYVYIEQNIAWNYTGARNAGVWVSRGDWLFLEDTDNIPYNNLYKEAIAFIEDEKNPQYDKIRFGSRPRVTLDEVVNVRQQDWKLGKQRLPHEDTVLWKRESYIRLKGCDERFAGRYAWSSTDWRRRFQRAGMKEHTLDTLHYYAVVDGETHSCECNKSQAERAKTIYCTTCKLPFRRKSGINYHMASGEHTQSPEGILNFTFTYATL